MRKRNRLEAPENINAREDKCNSYLLLCNRLPQNVVASSDHEFSCLMAVWVRDSEGVQQHL